MSNEIATYSMILSKLSLGKSGTECPTKTQILAINSLIVIENASTYGANECVKIDDIRKKAETWNYYLTVSPTSMSFGAGGGSKSFTVSSYKRKVLDGVEQSGDTNVSLKSTTVSGTGFSLSGTTVSASANEGTSNRTGTVTITQNESNKTATISLSQSGYVPPADNYVFTWHNGSTSNKSESFQATGAVSAAITLVSTKNGSNHPWSTTSHPSWITIVSETATSVTIQASNNTGSARSGEVVLTQSGSGKTLTINVSQEAKAADTYSWQIKKSSEPSEGAYWRQTISYNVPAKTTNFSGGFSVKGRKNGEMFASYTMSSDSPSWLIIKSSGNGYIVNHNTGSTPRSGTITLTQAESGLECYIEIYQYEYAPTYHIDVYPSSINVDEEAHIVSLTVNSYKTALNSNGEETHTILDYTYSSSANWFASIGFSTTNVTSIGINANTTTSERSGTFTLSQVGGTDTVTVTVTQAGKPADYLSIFNSVISTTAEYAFVNFKSSQPWTCSLTDYDADNPVIVGNTTGNARDNASVPFTYWKKYRRPRRVNYNIRQTAGQKLTASGSITFN